MNVDDKLLKLLRMNEEELRESLLLPLLSRMGFKYVMVYHGPGERGKDIVCLDTNRLGKREYMAVVAKAKDLDGNVSSPESLQAVLNQIRQCFDTEYYDLFGMSRVTMDRVWVVTTRRIVPGAEATVFGTLEKSNLSKLVSFVDGSQLVGLVDEHYPAYWDARAEPIDVLRDQRDRLLVFIRGMLAALDGTTPDIEATLNEVMLSPAPPKIIAPPDRTLTRLRPYRVEIERVDPEHTHNFFSSETDSIKKAFIEAKELFWFSMTEAEELLEACESVIAIENPVEFVKEFETRLEKKHSFSRLPFEWISKATRAIGKLEDALREVEALRERLRQIGKLEWASGVVDSLSDLTREVEVFLRETDQEEFTLQWRIDTVEGRGKLRLLYGAGNGPDEDSFTTRHNRQIDSFIGNETREITSDDVMADVRFRIKERFNQLLAAHGLLDDD